MGVGRVWDTAKLGVGDQTMGERRCTKSPALPPLPALVWLKAPTRMSEVTMITAPATASSREMEHRGKLRMPSW